MSKDEEEKQPTALPYTIDKYKCARIGALPEDAGEFANAMKTTVAEF